MYFIKRLGQPWVNSQFSTLKWSATTIFHLQCLVKQRPQHIFRSTLDPRDWLLCFMVKESLTMKDCDIFQWTFYHYRLQVSTLPYLYSGANKGGLHNISNPKINKNMVRKDLVKQIIKVIWKTLDVHYFTTFFEWCILSKLVLYFTKVSTFCLFQWK